jgi:hypothetical protein
MRTIATKGFRLFVLLTGILLLGSTTALAQVQIEISDLNANPDETVVTPVQVGDVGDEEIFSYDFTITYDPALVSVSATQAGFSDGENVSFVSNNPNPGELRVAVTSQGEEALTGEDVLANLEIDIASDMNGATPLSFGSFQFNEGMPAAATTDGSVTVEDVFVSLPTITQRQGTQIEIDVETGDLTGLDVSSYEFDLPIDGSILSNVEVVQEGTLSEGTDLVSNAQQDPDTLAVAASTGPEETIEGSGTLVTIRADLSSGEIDPLSFSSFQYNEGTPTAGLIDGAVRSADIIASLPDIEAPVGATRTIDIETGDLSGLGAFSYEFVFRYDSDVITVFEDSVVTEGTTTGDRRVLANVTDSTVTIATQGNEDPLSGSGSLIGIRAQVEGSAQTPLTFSSVQFNEGDPSAIGVDGSVSGFQNTAPAFTSVPEDFTVGPNTQIDTTIEAEDPDPQTITYSLVEAPDGAAIDSSTGRFTWQPTPAQADSTYDIGVRASDGAASSDTSFAVTVEEGNDPPQFTAVPEDDTVAVGEELTATVDANDPNGDEVSFSLTEAPQGAEIGSASGDFTFTPDQSQAGSTYDVGVRASDGAASSDTSFAVTVEEGNDPPQFTAVPEDDTVAVGEELTATVDANDPNGDEVSFSLTEAPQGAEIGSASGDFTFTPDQSQAGSTYDVGVRASDGEASSDTSFAVTVEATVDQPEAIAIDIDQSFGDATEDTNYRLVGLPGQVDLPIENTLEGEPGEFEDWRAFWDDGTSGSLQEGLIEFDGRDLFNFRPGRGFWVLSRNSWTVQQEVQTVSLDDQNRASIPLHDGWNIISNPLGEDVSWSAVQSENGVSEPLWSFAGSFSQSSTFASALTGEAYYFLNSAGLNELQIPYPTSSSSATLASTDEKGQTLRLDAKASGETVSSVWIGMRPEAKAGKDEHDHFAPPSYFTKATLSVKNQEIESPYALASDMRPADAEGHTYTLVLEEGDADERLTIEASGLSDLGSEQQARLYNRESGRSVDLRTTPAPEVKTPGDKTEFALLIGKASYVQQKEAEFVPDELAFRQNYPNPFRVQGQTTLEYSLPEQTEVSVSVYDILGRRVRTLVNGKSQRAGVHTVRWDGQNGQGQTVASGVYFARLEAGQTRTIKMVVID